jgi:hypothetical protein
MKLLTAPQAEEQSNAGPSEDSPADAPEKNRKRKNHPDDEDYPPHPDGKTWEYVYEKTPGERRLSTNRRVCKTLGMVHRHLSTKEQFKAGIEEYVNANGLGLSKLGRQFGTMVDRV